MTCIFCSHLYAAVTIHDICDDALTASKVVIDFRRNVCVVYNFGHKSIAHLRPEYKNECLMHVTELQKGKLSFNLLLGITITL